MDIQLKPYSLIELDYRKVEGFQGALKDLSTDNYEKLLQSLKTKGKFVPEFIFKQDNRYKLIDGHQRIAIYAKEDATFNGGYVIPFLLLDADNEKDAKEKLLLINSNYGNITKDGFDEFAWDLDTSWIKDLTTFDDFVDFEEEPEEEEEEGEVNLVFQVIADCKDEIQRQEVYDTLKGMGVKCKIK